METSTASTIGVVHDAARLSVPRHEARDGLVAQRDVGLHVGAVEPRHQDVVVGIEQKLEHDALAPSLPGDRQPVHRYQPKKGR